VKVQKHLRVRGNLHMYKMTACYTLIMWNPTLASLKQIVSKAVHSKVKLYIKLQT